METIPSLALIPSGYKASKVYSVLPTDGSGDLTFTRAADTATRVNSDGLIESVLANIPRLDYLNSSCPRLLLEPAATTLLQYSEQMDNAYWTKANLSVSANTTSTLDPSGYYGADKLVEAATTSTHEINHTIFALTAAPYTYSIFAKAAERSWIVLSIQGQYTFFDLANGVVGVSAAGNTAKIEAYSNGWYRCSITRTATASNNFGLIRLASADNTPSYAGDGTSGLYVWGANLTQSAYPTSYIGPTLGAAVTRGADAASKTGISSLIGQTEGTVFVEAEFTSAYDSNNLLMTLSDGTVNNLVYINRSNGSAEVVVKVSGVFELSYNSSILSAGVHKVALGYKANDFVVYIDGVLAHTDTSGSVPACSKLNVGSYWNNSLPYNNGISQALLFPTRLSNADLAALTA